MDTLHVTKTVLQFLYKTVFYKAINVVLVVRAVLAVSLTFILIKVKYNIKDKLIK